MRGSGLGIRCEFDTEVGSDIDVVFSVISVSLRWV
jgi:hypothetical protein